MNFQLILVLFCALTGPQFTVAQFEDLVECVSSDNFLPQFVSCLASGFGDFDTSTLPDPAQLVGAPGYEPDSGRPSRQLQSFAGHESNFDDAPTKYVINMKLKKMGVDHMASNSMYDQLVSYAHAWAAAGAQADTMAEKLRHLNLRKFVNDEYIRRFPSHFMDMMETALYLKEYVRVAGNLLEASGRPRQAVDICDILQLPPQLCDITPCLERYTPAEMEDSIEWLQCLFSCDHLAPIAQCSADLFTSIPACSRVQWFSDILVGIITAALNKTHCTFEVLTPQNLTQPIQLTEGGLDEYVEFKTYVPPGILCLGPDPLGDPIPLGLAIVGNVFGFDVNCDVEMQLTTANWLDTIKPYIEATDGRKKCRVPNRVSKQVAVGFHPAATNNSAVFKITETNWNETFSIPLMPVVDHRVDGQAEVPFTMKLVVQDELRGDTIKFPVQVNDTDIGEEISGLPPSTRINPVECYSLNDPHIMSFDGHYHSNFYHGAFHLYKHTSLPYEVQTIYQPCQVGTNNATCTCAVAVRSGDDVFVLDRCRRRCGESVCEPGQKVVMYTNGILTPGTRVFKMNAGLRHDVVLPHGTIIKIITSNDLINVWIMPGSYDKDQSEGLCGTYNGNSDDDLQLRDGTPYSGPGNGLGEQPQEFSRDWRVPDSELLFDGAPRSAEEFSPLSACHCTHILFSDPQCECGRGAVTELCDLYMDGEYAENISAIIRPSNHSSDSANYLDDIALDENYQPPILSGWPGKWNESAAETFCTELLANTDNELVRLCDDQTYEDAIVFCKQDIQLLDNTDWQFSTIDNAKFRCYNRQSRDVNVRRQDISLYPNNTCVNECFHRGDCANGICQCQEGYWGADCSLKSSTGGGGSNPVLTDKDTEICDSRSQICNFASISGSGFDPAVDMRCLVKNVTVSSKGVDYLSKRKTMTWEHDMIVVSMNQAVCPLPGNGSYEVTVAWRATTVEESDAAAVISYQRSKRDLALIDTKTTSDGSETVTFIFISHDALCYECDYAQQSCSRRETEDYCWINGDCWAPGATKPGDPCRYCDVTMSTSDWSTYTTDACQAQREEEERIDEEERKDKILRGVLGGCICAVVVVVVIIIFCVTRNKDKKTHMSETALSGNNVVPQPGTVMYADGFYKTDDGAYENLGLADDERQGSYDVMRHGSFGDGARPSLTRVDVLKNEDIHVRRHNSFGSESVRSMDSLSSFGDSAQKTAF